MLAFLDASRHPSGGFRNRAGRPELYYTVFGLGVGLALGVPMAGAGAIPTFLAQLPDPKTLTFVNRVSLIRCWRCLAALTPSLAQAGVSALLRATPADAVEALLCPFRARDGGFSQERPGAVHGTLYAAYLADQAYEDAGVALPDVEGVLRACAQLRTSDGGFGNHPGARLATTTATACAAILHARYDRPEAARQALDRLETLRAGQGGFLPHAGARLGDLLSTATACHALALAGRPASAADAARDAAWIESLWHANGGFRGHPLDPVADVEYTFYALLALGAHVPDTAVPPA